MQIPKMPQRLRSKNAWAATFALIIFVLKTYFHYQIPDVDTLTTLLLLAGAAWGIWTTP